MSEITREIIFKCGNPNHSLIALLRAAPIYPPRLIGLIYCHPDKFISIILLGTGVPIPFLQLIVIFDKLL